MSLDLLDTPLRITWDFPQGASTSAADAVAIAERISEAGVFFVALLEHPLRHAAVQDVLETLVGSRQLLNCDGSAGEIERLSQLASSSCDVQLDATGYVDRNGCLATKALTAALANVRKAGFEALLCMTPLRHNLARIPELVRFCQEFGVARFKLPNAHIGASFLAYSADELPRSSDLAAFKATWLEFARVADPLPVMEIHDLFLWEIMTPGQDQQRSEYGGCQAGNSLAHIDHRGVVHPCSAWPHPLGSLPGQSLASIWADSDRLRVRSEIASTPPGCDGCRDYDVCFGGCRGLAHHLNAGGDGRDLMCSGRR